mmetsp:Transcript_39760/g.88374  ORF Transcript_39760/g.88374 Transcript_39760/m.88374 type:complete len:203 (-) Transcript_39760:282-890(-)
MHLGVSGSWNRSWKPSSISRYVMSSCPRPLSLSRKARSTLVLHAMSPAPCWAKSGMPSKEGASSASMWQPCSRLWAVPTLMGPRSHSGSSFMACAAVLSLMPASTGRRSMRGKVLMPGVQLTAHNAQPLIVSDRVCLGCRSMTGLLRQTPEKRAGWRATASAETRPPMLWPARKTLRPGWAGLTTCSTYATSSSTNPVMLGT